MKRGKAVTGAQWEITVRLLVDDVQMGKTATMRYADAVVKDGWDRVGSFIVGRLNEVRDQA